MFSRIMAEYQQSVAVVIGAGGIGGEIVDRLAPVCRQVVVADRGPEGLLRCAQRNSGHAVLTRPLDVTDCAAVEAFFEDTEREVGPIQFCFYTAGILNVEPYLQTTADIWDRAVAVNLNGAFYGTHAAARRMAERRSGSILILGSIAGTKARSGSRVNPVYNATKAAITAYVNAAAMQLRPFGVRINSISPGPTATAMMAVQPAAVHEAVKQIMLDGRQNAPSEVAEVALFVAAQGRFTGEDIGLGGGAGLGG